MKQPAIKREQKEKVNDFNEEMERSKTLEEFAGD
jgi:hypothetical protein